ncbi:hypothetical protein BKM07_25620 [Pseudomonas syringae group genomosp. 3]|uniref:Uncharacterized protein n=1 Tax=Pseudomonas syringae group genomosp. 3 TaxID=251701 RepID=A0ABD6V3Y1_9PSED|nr:hypothetical protein BKM07_25620 [Pseudomonas syringae group genomosp. 3]
MDLLNMTGSRRLFPSATGSFGSKADSSEPFNVNPLAPAPASQPWQLNIIRGFFCFGRPVMGPLM